MNLSSGYILSAFDKYLKENDTSKKLLQSLSNFEVRTELFDFKTPNIDLKLAPFGVLNNIITRGFPTFASEYLEEQISELSEHLQYGESTNSSLVGVGSFLNEISPAQIYRNLQVSKVDQKILTVTQKEKTDSKFERTLLKMLEELYGQWIHGILCQQVPFSELLSEAGEFAHQHVDYLIPFPFEIHSIKGFIIEMDGGQHQEYAEQDLDKRRDNENLLNGFATIRISSDDGPESVTRKLKQLEKFLSHAIFEPFKNLEDNEERNNADELLLLPLACSRIQLSIVRAVLQNKEWLNSPSIKLAIVERDIQNTQVAVEDLNYWLSHFSILTDNKSLPLINCEIFEDSQQISDFDQYHMIIDLAMKARSGEQPEIAFPNRVIIRNASNHITSSRKIFTGPHLDYKSFGTFENSKWDPKDQDIIESLRYFLRSIFKKKDFRDGQLPILNRALTGQSVIGLLPTGGGKSLTYQLSALMQPGVCMVIDPIKSLMRDQVTGLKRHWIDSCEFINSSIKTREERVRIQKVIGDGRALFFFISPERLLIQEFRDYLQTMTSRTPPIYFSYCVIDEAHCVSEWGHDFRTSYLSVAENGIRFCTTHPESLSSIPIFALTATASYDVLTDIQRELSGNDMDFKIGEEAIIELEDHRRNELHFYIKEIKSKKLNGLTEFKLKEKLSELKNRALVDLIESHREDLKNEAGLIFCPHRSHFFGVTDQFAYRKDGDVGVMDNILRELPELRPKTGFFMGSGDNADDDIEDYTLENQDKFLDGDLNLLVATKAFGMGIDKDNIRFTVHYNYPSSIESFLQEAGRAGRDKEDSNCYLLFTDPEDLIEDVEFEVNRYFHNNAYKGAEKEKEIIGELLYKIFEPDRTYSLTADIQSEFDIEAHVTMWESRTGKKYLSVQESFTDRLGSLMIRSDFPIYLSDEVKDEKSSYSNKFAYQILSYLKDKITTKGNPSEIWDWLNSTGETREGIIDAIQSKSSKEKYSGHLEIAWENNIQERVKLIQQFVLYSLQNENIRYNENDAINAVKSAAMGKGSAVNFDDFVDKINTSVSKSIQDYTYDLVGQAMKRDRDSNKDLGTTLNTLQRHYHKLRDKADTEKAFYRLRLLGVIDDYTVDYRTQMFTVYISQKSNDFYLQRLSHYLSKFYSDDRVSKEITKAKETPGKDLIHRLLNYLVDFGYEQIAEKRARSIVDMKEACKYGVEKDKTPDELAEFLNLYLNSKYSREEYLVDDKNESLPHHLENGKVTDEKFVWHYIELMEKDGNSEVNNLKHMRGAALRMLRVSTDNPVLLSLAAYATFILEYSTPKLLDEAELNLMSALDYYEDQEGWEEKKLEAFFSKLIDIIKTKRPEITDHYQFEFENFRLTAINKSLKSINGNLDYLNKKLLNHG